MKNTVLIFHLTFLCALSLNSQVKDTTLLVEEVKVTISPLSLAEIKIVRDRTCFLREDQIRAITANDAGELIAKLSGANLKSYGGLGGLKTVSVRSLGSGHTATVVDGFTYANNQTGQVNFGGIITDNIVSIRLQAGNHNAFLSPVSSQAAGSVIGIQTFENSFYSEAFQVRASVSQGSYDQKNAYLALKLNKNKFFTSVYGKYRDAVGNYKFSYFNGSQKIEDVRKNNDYQDFYYGGTVGFKMHRMKARLGVKGSGINQGLPGAVIFYAPSSDERLTSYSLRAFGDLDGEIRDNMYYRAYSSYEVQTLFYEDPSYLSASNGLESNYTNIDLRSGVNAIIYGQKNLTFHGGLEHARSLLGSTDSTLGVPLRNQFYANIGMHKYFYRIQFNAMLSAQYVDERNYKIEAASNRFQLNPYFKIEYSKYGKWDGKHQLWYRNSFRMPTFNELYYNNVGNLNLLPENAHQINYGYDFVARVKGDLYIRTNAYFNIVQNKILAIPTQNLFVWSMQNIQKVHVYGAEAYFNYNYYKSNSSINISGNYTFQRVIDRTEESLNFGEQLAYSPIHMANLELAYTWKMIGIQISNSFTGMRYSLNENVEWNEVDAFYLLDVGVFYNFLLKEQNTLRVQMNVKNVLNSSYSYIRSYYMPGINYLITLSYALR